jgi:heat shock protein HspQ
MSTLSIVPRFESGEVVEHKLFGYRGVILGVDETYRGSDDWYGRPTRSRPPRDQPWYHVLVHGSIEEAYVAERHLQRVADPAEVEHPLVWVFFDERVEGRYVRTRLMS